MTTFVEMLLRGLVMTLIKLCWMLVLFPAALALSTPVILIRACFLAGRHQQKYWYAVVDGYDAVWTVWWAAL